MARIAIVETYPYEAVWGGDAVYLDRLRQFLVSAGHEVATFVTDIARGRADPRLRLQSRVTSGNHRWHVRRAVRTGAQGFLGYDPSFAAKLVARAAGRSAPRAFDLVAGERAWLVRRLATWQPHVAILAFGACAFTADVAETGARVLALKGFFSDRRLRLGAPPPDMPPIDAAMLGEVAGATLAGFNNLLDLRQFAAQPGAPEAALIGMSFPRRTPLPMGDGAELLFVAARTRPNVDALRWFLDGAWPQVRDAVPEARLRVVGAVGRAFADAPQEGVDIIGFADDIAAEYARAALVVAPFTLGSSGVKTKVAEALSFGCPLVTTSIGVDPAEPGQFGPAVDVADTPDAFAAAAVRLLRDPPLREARARLALEQYERHFSERAAYAPLIAMLQDIRP